LSALLSGRVRLYPGLYGCPRTDGGRKHLVCAWSWVEASTVVPAGATQDRTASSGEEGGEVVAAPGTSSSTTTAGAALFSSLSSRQRWPRPTTRQSHGVTTTRSAMPTCVVADQAVPARDRQSRRTGRRRASTRRAHQPPTGRRPAVPTPRARVAQTSRTDGVFAGHGPAVNSNARQAVPSQGRAPVAQRI
jgi:hypothetical protein